MSIQQLQNEIIRAGLASQGDFCGCSADEIHGVETRSGVALSGVYLQFLRVMGRRAGAFLSGSSVFYPELLQLCEWASEILVEAGSAFRLGAREFVFFMHQGYQFAYFRVDEGEDPPVWYFEEGWSMPQEKYSAVSAFFLSELADQRALRGR